MAQRGRPKKSKEELTVAVKVDHAKLLKQFEQEHQIQLKRLYKDLASIRHKVELALTKIGFIDEAESLAQASFKAGRAYGPLDEASDKLQEILEGIYENSDFNHFDDMYEEI